MKRNIEKMIDTGERLEMKHKTGLYSDELQALHERAEGGKFELARLCFAAGLAAGYQIRKKEEAAKKKAAAERAEKDRARRQRQALQELGYSRAQAEFALEYANKQG